MPSIYDTLGRLVSYTIVRTFSSCTRCFRQCRIKNLRNATGTIRTVYRKQWIRLSGTIRVRLQHQNHD